MSYKAYSGVQSVLSDTTLLAAIEADACTEGQLIAVKDVEWLEERDGGDVSRKFTTVYMWNSVATVHTLLEDLSGESSVSFPKIALSWWWNQQHVGQNTVFDEDTHLNSYAHLFVRPNSIPSTTAPGRWIAVHYATFLLHAGFTAWDQYKSGAIVPKEDTASDLGTAGKKIRHLFLSSNSIWVGDQHKISIASDGSLKFRKRKKGKIPEGLNAVTEVDVLASLDALTTGSSATHGNRSSGYELSLEEWDRVAVAQGTSVSQVADLFEDDDFEDATVDTDTNTMRSDVEINSLIQANVGNFFDVGSGLLLTSATPADLKNANVTGTDLSGYTPTSGLSTVISSHADVVTGAAAGGYFTEGVLNVMNAHADLKNDNVTGADLSGYTLTSGLDAVIGSHGDVAASKTVSGYFSGGALEASHYTDTQPKSDSAINTLIGSHGDVAASKTVSGYFSGGKLQADYAHADLKNANVVGQDLSGYTLTSGLDAVIGSHSDVTSGKLVSGYFSDGTLDTSHYTDTQPRTDQHISGIIDKNANVIMGTDVANLFTYDGEKKTMMLDQSHYTDTQPKSTSSINTLISGHADVSAGKAAGAKFDSSGNLKMSAQTSAMFGNDGTLTSSYFPTGLATTSDLGTYATTSAMNSGLSLKASATSVSNIQSGLVNEGLLGAMDIGLSRYYSASTIIVLSDRDLKNIIREIPVEEITTGYHLIGLTTYAYEWNQVAGELFGLSGTVEQGFIAEQLEELYPAPDPANPPTSIDDGHIWWHYHTSEVEKGIMAGVHDYYTQFNSEMLQIEIDTAIAAG